jgi:hypothetical protein
MTTNPLRWTSRLKELYGKPPYDPAAADGFDAPLLAEYNERIRSLAKELGTDLVDVRAAFDAHAAEHEGRLHEGFVEEPRRSTADGQGLLRRVVRRWCGADHGRRRRNPNGAGLGCDRGLQRHAHGWGRCAARGCDAGRRALRATDGRASRADADGWLAASERVWAYCHHSCAGIRFLFLDLDRGVDLATARRTSVVVLVGSLALTAWLGVKLW